MGWVGRMGLVDCVNEEENIGSFLMLHVLQKIIDALGATFENSIQESHLQIPGLLGFGEVFFPFFCLLSTLNLHFWSMS